jgi:hypothetical protein
MKLFGIAIFLASFKADTSRKQVKISGVEMEPHNTKYSTFCGFSGTRFLSSDKNSILPLYYANKYIGEEEGAINESGVSRPVIYAYGQKALPFESIYSVSHNH